MRILLRKSPWVARGFTLAAVLGLALILNGCLVDNDEYTQAKRERDDINGELQKLRRENDHLNLEIGRVYQECDLLSTQVALTAALALHDRFTADLGLARPAQGSPSSRQAAQPARQRGGSAVQAPARGSESTVRSGGGSSSRPSRSAGSGEAGGSGGAARPAAPPPPPPPPPPSRTSGAVDWGI